MTNVATSLSDLTTFVLNNGVPFLEEIFPAFSTTLCSMYSISYFSTFIKALSDSHTPQRALTLFSTGFQSIGYAIIGLGAVGLNLFANFTPFFIPGIALACAATEYLHSKGNEALMEEKANDLVLKQLPNEATPGNDSDSLLRTNQITKIEAEINQGLNQIDQGRQQRVIRQVWLLAAAMNALSLFFPPLAPIALSISIASTVFPFVENKMNMVNGIYHYFYPRVEARDLVIRRGSHPTVALIPTAPEQKYDSYGTGDIYRGMQVDYWRLNNSTPDHARENNEYTPAPSEFSQAKQNKVAEINKPGSAQPTGSVAQTSDQSLKP